MQAWSITVVSAAAVLVSCSSLDTRAGSSGFTLDCRDDRVDIVMDGRPFMAFHFHSKWDKPFLFPIRTISGTVISRGWPVEPEMAMSATMHGTAACGMVMATSTVKTSGAKSRIGLRRAWSSMGNQKRPVVSPAHSTSISG